jgi:hypothetical protein
LAEDIQRLASVLRRLLTARLFDFFQSPDQVLHGSHCVWIGRIGHC